MARECAACGGTVSADAVDPDLCDEVCARAWRYTTQTDVATSSPGDEVHRWNRVTLAAHQAEKGGLALPDAAVAAVPEGWSDAMLGELAEVREALRGLADMALLPSSTHALDRVGAACVGEDCEELFDAYVGVFRIEDLSPDPLVFRGQMTRLRQRVEAHWADQHRPVHWGPVGPRSLGAELDDFAAHLVAAQGSRG